MYNIKAKVWPCKMCGKRRRVENLSSRGRCKEHAMPLMRSAFKQMKERKGPVWEKYKSRMRAAVERFTDG